MSVPLLYLQGVGDIGGAERDLLALVSRLDPHRWHPAVACPGESSFARAASTLGIPVFPMEFPAWRKWSHWFRLVPALVRLRRLIRRYRPALLHANDLYYAPHAILVARSFNLPVVVTIRQELQARKVRPYRLDRADRLVTVSRLGRSVLLDAGVPDARICMISSGIDLQRFRPTLDTRPVREALGIPDEAPILGCVANILEVKGQDVLLHAFSILMKHEPTAYCLLVGRDGSPYAEELRRLGNRLGLSERLHFSGFQEDVRPYLSAMTVVVLASRAEGLPIALLEAMAMGKPVIASAVGGIPEIVVNGETGIVVPVNQPEVLAAAMLRLVKDPALCRAMGEAGRRRIQTDFDVTTSNHSITTLYSELLGQKAE